MPTKNKRIRYPTMSFYYAMSGWKLTGYVSICLLVMKDVSLLLFVVSHMFLNYFRMEPTPSTLVKLVVSCNE